MVLVLNSDPAVVDVHEMDGTVLYQFATGFVANHPSGISHQEGQYIIGDTVSLAIRTFDKNIPFHQGSKNWIIEECNISPSATRIVSRFKNAAGTTVTPGLVDEWTDIDDLGVSLLWGAAAEGYEKYKIEGYL